MRIHKPGSAVKAYLSANVRFYLFTIESLLGSAPKCVLFSGPCLSEHPLRFAILPSINPIYDVYIAALLHAP